MCFLVCRCLEAAGSLGRNGCIPGKEALFRRKGTRSREKTACRENSQREKKRGAARRGRIEGEKAEEMEAGRPLSSSSCGLSCSLSFWQGAREGGRRGRRRRAERAGCLPRAHHPARGPRARALLCLPPTEKGPAEGAGAGRAGTERRGKTGRWKDRAQTLALTLFLLLLYGSFKH